MKRQRACALFYGGSALVSAALGVGWWVHYSDPVLGVFFLVLAALSVPSYVMVTQPMRVNAARAAEREAMPAAAAGTSVNSPAPAAQAADDDGLPGSQSAEIVVERPLGYAIAVYRRYRIVIDGRPAGRVKRGEVLRTAVSPGPHTVAARIDWSGSPVVEVDVPSGGRVTVAVEPSSDAFIGMFSADKMLTLRVTSER